MAIEHHDWDLTFRAATDLLKLGLSSSEHGQKFACLSGAMVLTVASLESFMNSMGHGTGLGLSWDSYQRLPVIDKLRVIGKMIGIAVNVGHEPYQSVVEAFRWRNDLLHSKPEIVTGLEVDAESLEDVREKTERALPRKYEFKVNESTANRFHAKICEVIALFQKTGEELGKSCSSDK